MIRFDRDIDSLSNFKRRTSLYLKKMKKSGQPMVLTINGKAEMVVHDAKSYQKIMVAVARAKTLDAIRQGLQQIKKGKKLPLQEALAAIDHNLALARKS